MMTDKDLKPVDGGEEFYEEPPRMTARDTAGVVIALVALIIIGVAGYIWLTPDLTIGNLFAARTAPPQTAVHQHATPAETGGEALEHIRCDYCGMYADTSTSHIVVDWNDGSRLDYDSWDCALNSAIENNLVLESAEIIDYASIQDPADEPVWLDASTAVYLYDTEPILGAMPPYTVAFSSREAALAEQAELGGTLVGFSELLSKWDLPVAGETSEPATAPAIGQHQHEMMDQEPVPAEPPPASEEAPPAVSPLTAPHTHDHDMSCPICGMPADSSLGHVVAQWSDGSHTHHDSWDCLINYEQTTCLQLVEAVVLQTGTEDSPVWLDAQSAWYLYETKKIKGSMPPFIAAFATRAAAEAAQPELGGELVDFTGLRAKWES